MKSLSTNDQLYQKILVSRTKPTIVVAGKYSDNLLMQCRKCGAAVAQQNDIEYQENVFFETQWVQYLKKLQLAYKGQFLAHKQSPLVFLDDGQGGIEYIGNEDRFLKWALYKFRYFDESKIQVYRKLALSEYIHLICKRKDFFRYAYLDIKIGEEEPQRVVFELFKSICPRTVKNFLHLCRGKYKNKAGYKISYEDTVVHRIVKNGYIQAGDISKTGAKGNYSIYEGNFEDESHTIKHNEIGMLGMCKKAGMTHSNESQFYVTLSAPMTFLDERNFVAFGRVIQGMRTINLINKVETSLNERPLTEIKIIDSGKFKVSKKGRLHALHPKKSNEKKKDEKEEEAKDEQSL